MALPQLGRSFSEEFVAAVGLRYCRAATVEKACDGVVTINAECYAYDEQLDDEQLGVFTGKTVSRRMVLVDADEYARLKQLDAGDPRRQMTELVVRGGESLDEARAAFGLPPVASPEAPE